MLEPATDRGAEVARLLSLFKAAGAAHVDPEILQPADVLLDLYGEDIRARTYRTDDPVHGEQMLRPDFTVPIVQTHMAAAKEPARYTYAGPVWRRQEYNATDTREFWQVGFEIFDRAAPEAADAEVFALISEAVDGVGAVPITGDLAFLFAAIDGLKTRDARKSALRRHVWRPGRFARLLERYSGATPFPADQRDWSGVTPDGTAIGLRSAGEISARIESLIAEQATPDLSVEEVGMITTLLSISGKSAACFAGLSALSRSFPKLSAPLRGLEARLSALSGRGFDADALPFDATFGRQSMEYYDGFTFAFRTKDGGAIAQGGRYDALTRVLGGDGLPAVGGVVRPGLLAAIKGGGA